MMKQAAGPARRSALAVARLTGMALLCLSICMSLLMGRPALVRGETAKGEQCPPPPPPSAPGVPNDFDNAVRLALHQSPFFVKSALEIQVKRLGEKDSKSDFFPSLQGSARYYLVQPKNNSSSQNYQWAISTPNYNPLFAYLSLKANRIVTQIATLGHQKGISAGIERLGKAYLEMHALQNLARLRAQATDLAKENLNYVRQRQRLGEVTPLEVQIASQEVDVAVAEQEDLSNNRKRLEEGVANFLGIQPGQPANLDVKQARRQVLNDFDPRKADLQDAETRNIDLRIKQMAKELQTWHVSLAKMKFMPSVNVSLQSPDPLSNNANGGTFFSAGVSFPIFDGFKRVREVSRQKLVLEQFGAEETVSEKELSQKWREAQQKITGANAAFHTAKSQQELACLKESQAETAYRGAEKDFSILMTARQTRVKAQMDAVKKGLEYDEAVLALRALSGDLVYHYVNECQFQK